MSNKIRKEKKTGKKIIALIFVFISVFCSVFFAARGRFAMPITENLVMTIMSPFQRAFSWAGNQLASLKDSVTEISHLHEQNKQLREEVELLRAQNVTASEYASENQRLRSLLGYKQVATQFDLVAASVIGRESASWSSVITINRGTLDGVANNMAVVTELGLVGHVLESGLNSAKVQLLIDPRSSVGTLIQRPESRVAGIVEGDIKNPSYPRMVNIPKDSDVQVNDTVVTSGYGGVYPKGLVVGKIIEIRNEEGGLLKYGVIDTSVDNRGVAGSTARTDTAATSNARHRDRPRRNGAETSSGSTADSRRSTASAGGSTATTAGGADGTIHRTGRRLCRGGFGAMRIIGLWAMLLVLCYALQTSLLTFVSFDGFSANLMLLLTVSITFLRGHEKGVFFGFMAGLLQDTTTGSYFGLATFSYMTIGLIFGKFSVNLFREQSLLPVISSIPALAIHFAITIAFLFLLDRPIDLVKFLREDFWLVATMQVVLAYPVHRLVLALHEFSKRRR